MKVKLTKPCLSCEASKVEVFGDVFGHPVCYLLNLIAGSDGVLVGFATNAQAQGVVNIKETND